MKPGFYQTKTGFLVLGAIASCVMDGLLLAADVEGTSANELLVGDRAPRCGCNIAFFYWYLQSLCCHCEAAGTVINFSDMSLNQP